VAQLWEGKTPKWQLARLTPEQIGLIAIDQLATRGHEMLAEFEIVNGVAKRKQMTRFILEAKDIFFGNIATLERVLVRGERLPTWKEVSLSALDMTLAAAGVGALAKLARVGSGAVVEKSAFRLAADGAFEAIRTVAKTSTRIGPFAFAYIAITRPALIASAGGWIAEQLGFKRIYGIFAIYMIGISLVFVGLSFLLQFLRPLALFATIIRRSVRGPLHGRRRMWLRSNAGLRRAVQV
jgi:hypothetical protein